MQHSDMPRKQYGAYAAQYEYAEKQINELNPTPRPQTADRRPFILGIEDCLNPYQPFDRLGDTVVMAYMELTTDEFTTLINDIKAVLVSHGAVGDNHRDVFGRVD